ncbi:ABC transporter permease [Arthrobacter glacialis]|uniref:ABC transporter permease n=1 Tax=Arthrobacter glacialis TaxID=1664 RepID=UPI001A9F3D9E|nr:ABC transporter permease [Arthrobacter glacialis]
MSKKSHTHIENPPGGDSPDLDAVELSPEDAAEAAAAKRAKAETIGRYVAMFMMPLIMVGMMVTGYLGTMHAPSPNNMPIAVIGSSAQADQFVGALVASNPDAVNVRNVDSAASARQLVIDRDVSGAVYIADGSATVFTASAAGSSQASVVKAMLAPHVLAEGLTLQTEDLVPLPATDAAGLGAMFLATALVMAGYLPFSMVLSNSPELLRFRRAIPLLAGWAALVAALVWTVTGPILGVVQGHAMAVLGIAWLGVFAIGSVQLLLTRFLGPMATIAAMLFLTVLGMPASNMSMSVYTMPGFFTFLHSILPTPAIGEALRSALYFDGAGVWPHLLVLIIGGVLALMLTLAVDARKRRSNPNATGPKPSIPSLHGGPRPKSRFWRYGALLLFPLGMVTMMISVMLGAMSAPMPQNMPIAIVGTTVAQAQQAVDGLDENMPGLFELRAVDSTEEAHAQVQDRTVTAAFVLPSAEKPAATLVTNQAGGSSAQQVVTAVFGQVAAGLKVDMVGDEIAPLHSNDTMGSVSMYIAMGWILAGFMIIIVGANAAPKSRPLPKLVPIVAAWSVFISAVLWLIAGPITGSVDGHFWQLWGVGAIAVFAVAMFSAVVERLIGMLSIIPVIGLMMLVGVPASGGGLSVYMEPEIFRVLHGILPMPAAVESVRSILYFGADTVGHHLLTLGFWGVGSLIVLMMIDKIKPPRTELHPIDPDEAQPAVAPAREAVSA